MVKKKKKKKKKKIYKWSCVCKETIDRLIACSIAIVTAGQEDFMLAYQFRLVGGNKTD